MKIICIIFSLLTSISAGVATCAISLLDKPKHQLDQHMGDVNPAAQTGGTLRLAHVGTFESLNLANIHASPAQGLELLHDSLMFHSFDEPFAMYGILAEKAEIGPKNAWITFSINPCAKWADGKPVTADDVVFTYEFYKMKGAPGRRAFYKNINAVEKIDKLSVKFSFIPISTEGEYNPEFPFIVGLMKVLPKHSLHDQKDIQSSSDPILGSGPYEIVSHEIGKSTQYKLRDNYWGKDLPANRGRFNFQFINFEYYREPSVALQAFKSASYDVITETDPINWRNKYNFPNQPNIIKFEAPLNGPPGCFAIALNQRNPMLRDMKVRKALNLLFPFEGLDKVILRQAYKRTDSFFPASDFRCVDIPQALELEILQPYKNNLPDELFTQAPSFAPNISARAAKKEALALLKQAGWSIKKFKLVNQKQEQMVLHAIINTPQHEKLLLIFKKALAEMGIVLKIYNLEPAQYMRRISNYDFDMMLFSWRHSYSPGLEQTSYWGSESASHPGTRNYNGIQNPVVDQLCSRIIRVNSRIEQVNTVRALDRVLQWGYYVIPLYYAPKTYIAYYDKLEHPEMKEGVMYSLYTWWNKKK